MTQPVDRNGTPLTLVLYKFDRCPYCVRVMKAVQSLGIPVSMRDTLRDPGAREELISIGGSGQVPCLVINGTPLYESADIVRFLENEVKLIA